MVLFLRKLTSFLLLAAVLAWKRISVESTTCAKTQDGTCIRYKTLVVYLVFHANLVLLLQPGNAFRSVPQRR